MRHTAAVIATVALLAPSLSTQAPVGPTAGLAVELKPTGGRGLTEVHGIKVGSVTLPERPTGCTVVLVDGEGVPGGVSQRGGAPGTSETDLLHPLNMVDKVNAIVLAGGSAYGLEARTGVDALSRGTEDWLARIDRCRADRAVGDPVRPRVRQASRRAPELPNAATGP